MNSNVQSKLVDLPLVADCTERLSTKNCTKWLSLWWPNTWLAGCCTWSHRLQLAAPKVQKWLQKSMKPYRVTLHKAEQLEFKENKNPCTEIHHKYIFLKTVWGAGGRKQVLTLQMAAVHGFHCRTEEPSCTTHDVFLHVLLHYACV